MYIMLQYKSKEKYILHESEKKDMSITEFEKLEKVLEENCGKYDTDCNKCPLKKECEKYAEYKELYEMATK